MATRFTGGCIYEASAMNVRLIQSQWGIAIAVIASEHRAALMLQRCLSLPVQLASTGR